MVDLPGLVPIKIKDKGFGIVTRKATEGGGIIVAPYIGQPVFQMDNVDSQCDGCLTLLEHQTEPNWAIELDPVKYTNLASYLNGAINGKKQCDFFIIKLIARLLFFITAGQTAKLTSPTN